jgi:hypothetical protein
MRRGILTVQWCLSAVVFAFACSPNKTQPVGRTQLINHTQLVGWPPSLSARAAAASREIEVWLGVTPDTFALSPGELRIVFLDPPFAPVWASAPPDGGTSCHDLGATMREVALPIAREVYRLSPTSNGVDTISVAVLGHATNGTSGSCSMETALRFRPAELIPRRSGTTTVRP